MKKIIIQMLTISALFLLVACGNKDEAADELIKYYNEEWIPIQAMKKTKTNNAQDNFLENYSKQGEDDEKNKEVIALYKDEIIPIADEVLEQLKFIELEHRKVKKMNDLQIKAEEFAKTHLENAIDLYKGNISEEQYKKNDAQLKEKYDTVLEYRDELMEKYDLEYDKEKGEVDGFYELKHKKE